MGWCTSAVTTEVHEHVKRRYGTRPATTVRSERVRVWAASEEAPLAHAVRRLGWRVYATNHTAEELSLAQGVAAYRSEYLIEQGFGRLKGRSLSLTPLFLHDEHRVVALICLLSIALRVLVLMQFVVRRNLQQARRHAQRHLSGAAGTPDGATDDGDDAVGFARRDAVAHHDQRQTPLSSDTVECRAKAHPRTDGGAARDL